MRLIDADALLDKQESLYMKGNVLFHGVTACAIENAPTIDPETMPMAESRKEMMEDIADAVRALCEALQDGCDDETTKEYSKAACRLALRLCIFELDTIGGTYNEH